MLGKRNLWSTVFLIALIGGLALFSVKPEITGMFSSVTKVFDKNQTSIQNQSAVQEPSSSDNLYSELAELLEKDSLDLGTKMRVTSTAELLIQENPGKRIGLERIKFLASVDEPVLALDEARILFEGRETCFPMELQKTILFLKDGRQDLLDLSKLQGSLEAHSSLEFFEEIKTKMVEAVDYYNQGNFGWARLTFKSVNKTVDFTC